MSRTYLRLFLSTVLSVACGVASAAPISWQGTLALSDGAANATARHTFGVSTTSLITVQSYGYGGSAGAPGGTNLAGAVIPPGGFDPYTALFSGVGDGATFLASDDDAACMPPSPNGDLCPDSALSLTLNPGTYTLVVAAFENMSLAENLGTGVLGDGFVALGNYDPSRTGNFAIDISGSGIDSIFANGFE